MQTAGGYATSMHVVPISYSEIEAWSRLTGRRVAPWEVDLLRSIDAAWLAGPRKGEGDAGRNR